MSDDPIDSISSSTDSLLQSALQGVGQQLSQGMAQTYLQQRYISPADLVDGFNPERLLPQGPGNAFIGGDPAATGPFYVFFTRPNLNISGDGAANAAARLGIGTPTAPAELAQYLQGGQGLIYLLSNLCTGYDAQDIVLDTHNIAEGWDGAKQTIPRGTINSRQDGTVNLTFREWSGTPVTLMNKIWVDYIDAVAKGFLSPTAATLRARELDYACSIYCFQTLADGATIEFGCRFTGAYPTAVPFSPWGGKIGGGEGVEVTVPFHYNFYEPMDAAIFDEFSQIALNDNIIVGAGNPFAPVTGTRNSYFILFGDAKMKPDGI